MPTEPGERPPLPALLTRAKDLTIDLLHQRLEEQGFTGIRYRHGSVFRFIDDDGSRLTVLAERSALTKQAIGELVDELERLGYVERAADPGDRRAKIIRLTARGAEGQAAAARILVDIEQQWSEHLGANRITLLRDTVQDIITLHSGESPLG
ncbi:MarR family winged helix-turn-helix transcriptional regulator [Actinokineospora cianjurensis]|uniref:MarR family transcriptional regulator n=1 Tax=Actinokineospora cianjurensis TaxID=585224 RepID=A0A421B352_9PSEU|nr:MarR family transcriptional regulator [Actinokineospora cianjurensis]RLK58842.1 MarR family transcriptional regulator [Actinokineospora cianjurensis]